MKQRMLERVERFFNARVVQCLVLKVVDCRHVTPLMLRVSFSGQNLDTFDSNDNLHVKLLLPPAGAPHDRWLVAGVDGKARLRRRKWLPVFRKYTIRAIDAKAGRVVIDFVLHADAGPGAAWALRARPGDVVGMIGPGGRGLAPADWYLFAGDETALPAIGRMLEALPADARGQAFVQIAGPAEAQRLRKPDGIKLHWLSRNGAQPGTTQRLADAVAGVRFPCDERAIFVWAGAEHREVHAIHAHLRRERGLEKRQFLAVAYWRREPLKQKDAD